MKQKILILLLLFSAIAYSQEYAKNTVKSSKITTAKSSGEADDALKEYERLERLAKEFLEQKEFVQATGIYTQMLALNIKTGTVYQLRGIAHALNEDSKAALNDFNAAIEHKAPDLPSIYFMRGMSKFNLQDNAGACTDLKQAKALGAEVDESFFGVICGKL